MTQEQQQFFSASELSGLAGMPQRPAHVARLAKRKAWPFRPRTGRGGGREYPLACLPMETQSALAQRLIQSATASHPSMREEVAIHVRGQGTSSPELVAASSRAISSAQIETLAAVYEAKPQTEKDEAAARLAIVSDYEQLRTSGVARLASLDTVAGKHSVSVATIQRYLSLVAGKPEHAWLYLLTPRYCGRTNKAEMSAEAWEVLKADYLRLERPSACACIERIRRVAADKGWHIPSTRTLLRRLDRLPRAMKELARKGPKAAQQLYPAQARDKSALTALGVVNADGYMHNVWVAFPDGEVRRAKTWFWQDVYSSKFLTWRTDKTEHTDVIRLSFGDLVERFGIPHKALIDNTRAAANKTMSGGVKHRFRFKVREDEPDGVFKLLNVDLRWAIPEHGQSKPVERAFGVGGIGEIVDKAPELAGSWTGPNPLDKPEYDGKIRAIPLEQLERVIEREVAAYNAQTGRRGAVQQGRSFDEVFNASYASTVIRRATEAQRRLWLLATEPVKAGAKDGAITLDAGRLQGRQANRYWASAMVDYAGQSVVARFDPRELHSGVHVYTIDGRYICYADCFEAKGFNDQAAGREHNRARNAYVRAQKIALGQERRMDALQAARTLTSSEQSTIPAPKIDATVVRGEFRRPLEVPRAIEVPEAELVALSRELQRPKLALPADPNERYAWYVKLAAAAARGEPVPAELEGFLESYPASAERRSAEAFFQEFAGQMDVDEYARDLVLETDVETAEREVRAA